MDNPPSEIQVDDTLVLKRLRLETSHIIFQAVDQDREHLQQWLPWVEDTKKHADTEIFIKSVLKSNNQKQDLVYEIWDEQQFAGLIVLKEIDRWNKKTELGYWITLPFEGRGIITKSCAALIDYAFNNLGMNRVQLKAAPGNARSCMVAERLHFKMEGIERAGELHRRHYLDLVVYSILKKEWEEREF